MNITLILQINAPAAANLNLAAQLLMGSALLVGMFLARRKLFRAHAVCQSVVVLINLIPISAHYMARQAVMRWRESSSSRAAPGLDHSL